MGAPHAARVIYPPLPPPPTHKRMKGFFVRITGICRKVHLPHPGNHTDKHLLHWFILTLCVLLCLIVLVFCGVTGSIDSWLHSLLVQLPFYPEAQDGICTVNPATVFLCSIPITLYGAAVLVHEDSLAARSLLCLLAGMVLALPCIICLLWGTLLGGAIPLCSIGLLWVFSACIPYFRATAS